MKNISVYRFAIILVWICTYGVLQIANEGYLETAMFTSMKIALPLFFLLSLYELYLFYVQKESTNFDKKRIPLDGVFATKMSYNTERILRLLNPVVWLIIWIVIINF